MSKYHDDSTAASDPGGVRLARDRLALWKRPNTFFHRVFRSLFGDRSAEIIDEHLRLGDSRAAVVISRSPLLVAAYTDELDCVAVLSFADELAERFGLAAGARLLTVNTYSALPAVAPDLTLGPSASPSWQNFYPLIAELLSEDVERIAERKEGISEAEWQRCLVLGREYVSRRPGVARDGSPFASFTPASAS